MTLKASKSLPKFTLDCQTIAIILFSTTVMLLNDLTTYVIFDSMVINMAFGLCTGSVKCRNSAWCSSGDQLNSAQLEIIGSWMTNVGSHVKNVYFCYVQWLWDLKSQWTVWTLYECHKSYNQHTVNEMPICFEEIQLDTFHRYYKCWTIS